MALVRFTPNLARHVACPDVQCDGDTVRAVLDGVFESNPRLRGYVLDEQGHVRKHMVVFLNGVAIADRDGLSDPIPPGEDEAEVFVMQALSGG